MADMLTRIRNGLRAEHDLVEMPFSRLKSEVARVLKKEGYITDYVVQSGERKSLRLYLKYGSRHEPAIRGLRRESRGGLRKYVKAGDIPRVLGGQGMAVLSTSSGVMTDREARERHVGGEVLCTLW